MVYIIDKIYNGIKFNRFGVDPIMHLTGSKEYLFFTKPDLHLVNIIL